MSQYLQRMPITIISSKPIFKAKKKSRKKYLANSPERTCSVNNITTITAIFFNSSFSHTVRFRFYVNLSFKFCNYIECEKEKLQNEKRKTK